MNPKIKLVETEYGMVLMDSRHGGYFELNESGAAVLAELMRGGDRESAATALVTTYGIPRSIAERDTQDVVAELLEAGLLVEQGGAPR